MNSDLTFITNEQGHNLKERFKVLIKDTKFFDCLVGYFYASGFHTIYKSLEKTKKIRILIGISTNLQTYDLMRTARDKEQTSLSFSSNEIKTNLGEATEEEMKNADDNEITENGIYKFIEWINLGKLEIKAYPSEKIHAKIYIMTFGEDDRDKGRVITGSSNFTQSGLVDNLEFNVELKNPSDYDFALSKFQELWENSIDVSQKYVETIKNKTWLNDEITPYELYLKFLYEYFKDDLSRSEDVFIHHLPEEFKQLEYQKQAVLNAKKILYEYGGVFISDVVGLGKTYISAILAGQINEKTLVIAPPALLDENNPGSWKNAFFDFQVSADYESIGKLDRLIKRGTDKYQVVIIDEAHRFRNESNETFEQLAEICRGKRVILVTATPYNNSPKDILSQIKLFQKVKKSTIPGVSNLENFFNVLEKRLRGLDRQKDHDKYISIIKENANEIREKVLKYLMVRRTRSEIVKYFKEDLDKQKLKFPEVEKPKALFYKLNQDESDIFDETVKLIVTKFKYTRYTPMIYYKGEIDSPIKSAQQNMAKFMKIVFIKRLESSFFAFNNSLGRFINSYEQVIKAYMDGYVYVSKKYTSKIFELLENDDDTTIQQLLEDKKAEKYKSEDFEEGFIENLKSDLETLQKIKSLWSNIHRDPKLLTFIKELKEDPVLKNNKIIIFSESKETAEYLFSNINKEFCNEAVCYTGGSSMNIREQVIENFDAKAKFPKDDFRILIATEVLAEGVNLHRSNVVINYDIPWNPTRMMQRVGRINRVDTKFNKIFTYNFFPTVQSNNEIKLKEAAESKINAFLTLLGDDAPLLTEGEPIGSHELFSKLTSKETITGEKESDESELKYLNIIKLVRDNDPKLFEKIKKLPPKARTCKKWKEENALLTYFRKGKIQKFFIIKSNNISEELGFIDAASVLESKIDEKRSKLSADFYEKLDLNKKQFILSTTEELLELKSRGGGDNSVQILKIIKATLGDRSQFKDDQENSLKNIIQQLKDGGLPKQTTKKVIEALNNNKESLSNPLKVFAILEANIPKKLLGNHLVEENHGINNKREVILSEYLIK